MAALLWAVGALTRIAASPAAAQLPGASAAVPARGYAATAVARGATAPGTNPAGLALSGTPRWSLLVPGAQLRTGMGPVTLGDLADFEGRSVPRGARLEWLARVEREGRQGGTAGLELTAVAASLGAWGIQLSSVAGGRAALGPDAAEILLFGNAGRTGEPRELDLRESRLDFFAVTTLGVSRGFRVARGARGDFALGATVALSVGHAVLVGRDAGSLIRNDPVEVELDLPVVHQSSGPAGAGVGLDVAAAWQKARWSAGVVVKNLLHGFEWDGEKLVYRPGQALFDVEDVSSDFDERPFGEAPLGLRRRVDDLTFRPRLHLGVGFRATPSLTLTGEIRRRLGREGLPVAPASLVGLGAEYALSAVSLRAGGGYVSDGWMLGGGLGVRLGPARISGTGLFRGGPDADETLWMLSLTLVPG